MCCSCQDSQASALLRCFGTLLAPVEIDTAFSTVWLAQERRYAFTLGSTALIICMC